MADDLPEGHDWYRFTGRDGVTFRRSGTLEQAVSYLRLINNVDRSIVARKHQPFTVAIITDQSEIPSFHAQHLTMSNYLEFMKDAE